MDNAKKTLANEDLTMIATADAVSDEEMAVSEVHEDDHAEEQKDMKVMKIMTMEKLILTCGFHHN